MAGDCFVRFLVLIITADILRYLILDLASDRTLCVLLIAAAMAYCLCWTFLKDDEAAFRAFPFYEEQAVLLNGRSELSIDKSNSGGPLLLPWYDTSSIIKSDHNLVYHGSDSTIQRRAPWSVSLQDAYKGWASHVIAQRLTSYTSSQIDFKSSVPLLLTYPETGSGSTSESDTIDNTSPASTQTESVTSHSPTSSTKEGSKRKFNGRITLPKKRGGPIPKCGLPRQVFLEEDPCGIEGGDTLTPESVHQFITKFLKKRHQDAIISRDERISSGELGQLDNHLEDWQILSMCKCAPPELGIFAQEEYNKVQQECWEAEEEFPTARELISKHSTICLDTTLKLKKEIKALQHRGFRAEVDAGFLLQYERKEDTDYPRYDAPHPDEDDEEDYDELLESILEPKDSIGDISYGWYNGEPLNVGDPHPKDSFKTLLKPTVKVSNGWYNGKPVDVKIDFRLHSRMSYEEVEPVYKWIASASGHPVADIFLSCGILLSLPESLRLANLFQAWLDGAKSHDLLITECGEPIRLSRSIPACIVTAMQPISGMGVIVLEQCEYLESSVFFRGGQTQLSIDDFPEDVSENLSLGLSDDTEVDSLDAWFEGLDIPLSPQDDMTQQEIEDNYQEDMMDKEHPAASSEDQPAVYLDESGSGLMYVLPKHLTEAERQWFQTELPDEPFCYNDTARIELQHPRVSRGADIQAAVTRFQATVERKSEQVCLLECSLGCLYKSLEEIKQAIRVVKNVNSLLQHGNIPSTTFMREESNGQAVSDFRDFAIGLPKESDGEDEMF